MSIQFSPKLRSGSDVVERWLLGAAHYVLLGGILLLPVLFWPNAQLSLGFTKSFGLLIAVAMATILYSLFVLRVGAVRVVAPLLLLTVWGLALVAVVSALLSGDHFDALFGDVLPTGTAAFIVLIALTTTATALVIDSKRAIIRFLFGFSLLAFVVQLWQLVRLFAGPEYLSFGVFSTNTLSVLGSFNDAALFSGLVIVLSIVVLQQLSIRGWGLGFVIANIALGIGLLAIINFFTVWLVVGFFALLVFLYLLTRDRLLGNRGVDTVTPQSWSVLIIVGVVCAVAATFVVAGTYVGSQLSKALAVEYTEVRPSLPTTLDITGDVYRNDNALLGVGPNRFEDAWRVYKNPIINETLYWNATFAAGNSYITTLFVTLGITGGVLAVLFLGMLGVIGYRSLVLPGTPDPFWYFVATTAAAASAYLWGMSLMYVPGPALLLAGAFFAGLLVAAHGQLVPAAIRVHSFTDNRARVFVLIGVVMVVITLLISALFVVSKQYVAHAIHANALASATADTQVLDRELEQAMQLYASDTFIAQRVQLRLGVIRSLLNIQSPSPADIERFNTAAVEALALAGQAVTVDGSNPQNHLLLGSVYGVLAIAGATTTTRELASASFARARELDPMNPEYPLIEAQLSAREGELERAREYLNQALGLKRNYVDALYLLSQVEVSQGNAEAAIASAQAIVSIEPKNPARYFQLGTLFLSSQNPVGAAGAFRSALTLDSNFANARYLLALIELEAGNRDTALDELRIVQATNQDNASLAALITQLESGQVVSPPLGITTPVDEPAITETGDGVTTTVVPPDTDLIVPVNRREFPASDSTADRDDSNDEAEVPEASSSEVMPVNE